MTLYSVSFLYSTKDHCKSVILEFLGRKKNRVKTQKKSHDFLSCLNGVLGPHDGVIISLYIIGSKVEGKVEGL